MSSDSTLYRPLTRRSRNDAWLSSSSVPSVAEFTLGKLMDHLQNTDVPGPIRTQNCNEGSKLIGQGAQFEVFSRQVQVTGPFVDFDEPFSTSFTNTSQIDGSKKANPTVYQNSQGDIVEYTNRIRLIAIKRARLVTSSTSQLLSSSKSSKSTGAERRQLRDTILEVVALINTSLRQHPNIVTLLAWGYDELGDGERHFSPTLFVEHATASLSDISKKMKLPWGVKNHLCCGTVLGLAALHECGIVHGDLKPDNVLVFSNPQLEYQCRAKISDFGMSTSSLNDAGVYPVLPRGTHGWAAPEQITFQTVTQDNAHLCDIWSCGMTIWSSMIHSGVVPTYKEDILKTLHMDFFKASAPVDLVGRLVAPLSRMLQTRQIDRSKTLLEIKAALTSEGWEDSEEEKQSFIFMIRQPADSGLAELENQALTGMPLFKSNQRLDTPQAELNRDRRSRKSWMYDGSRAFEFASKDKVLLNQLEQEPISTSELFTISMAHALEWRYTEEIRSLYSCAQRGYLPAQALYSQVLSARIRAGAVLAEQTSDPPRSWTFKAIESGYLFPALETTAEESSLAQVAWTAFRESGGYNNHYCSMVENANVRVSENAHNSGLHGDLEKDLGSFKLHLGAALNLLVTENGPSCLLDIEDSINSRDHWGDTAVIKACMAGHINSLRALINAHADASLVNNLSGVSALHWLFVFPDEHVDEACKLLYKGGGGLTSSSQVTALESFHFPWAWPSGTPLHWAVFSGRQSAVRAIVAHGADINHPDLARQTPLHIAMKMAHVEMVQLLLDLRANIKTYPDLDDSGHIWSGISPDPLRTPVHDFIWSTLEVGLDADYEDFDNGLVNIPSHYEDFVFKDGKESQRTRAILEILISHEPSCLMWRDSKDWTCINYLLNYARVDAETLQFVLDHSPPVDEISDDAVSILYFALLPTFPHKAFREPNYHYDLELSDRLRQLLGNLPPWRRTAFVNRPEPMTPKNSDLWSSADLEDLEKRSGRTILHYAAINGLPACTKLLLEYGANPTASSLEKMTPLEEVSNILEAMHESSKQQNSISPNKTTLTEKNTAAYWRTQNDLFDARLSGRKAAMQILQEYQLS